MQYLMNKKSLIKFYNSKRFQTNAEKADSLQNFMHCAYIVADVYSILLLKA